MADDCDLDEVAELTEECSGANITNICRYGFKIKHSNLAPFRYIHESAKIKFGIWV